MKYRFVAIMALGLVSCQPFGDTATPAAESVYQMSKLMMAHSSQFERIVKQSKVETPESAAIRDLILDNIAKDRAAFKELSQETMAYLEKLGKIDFGSPQLAGWASIFSKEFANWLDPRLGQ